MSVLDRPVPMAADSSSGSIWKALVLTFTLALVAIAILLPVMQSSDETAQGYRIRALEQQQVDLEAKIYSTQSDIAQLGSLARIDDEARNRLGMVPADRTTGVDVSVPAPAARTVPSRYLPASSTPAAKPMPLRQKLLHLLPLN